MNITRQDIDNLDTIVTIEVQPEDYNPLVKKELTKLSKSATIKGFRKGHVPIGFMKKMYGNQVLFDEVIKFVNGQLDTYIKENDFKLLGRPIAVNQEKLNIDIKNPEKYDFSFELGFQPEFEIDLFNEDAGTVFTKHVIAVDDEMVNKEIEGLQKRFGESQTSEAIENENDILIVEMIEMDENTQPKEGGITVKTNIMLDMVREGSIKKQIKGITKEKGILINIFDAFEKPKEEVVKFVLNQQLEDVDMENISSTFRVNLEEIKSMKEAELNEELFAKIFPEEEVKTEEEFKEKLKERVGGYFTNQSSNKLVNQIVEHLMAETNIPMPEQYLQKLLEDVKAERKRDQESGEGKTGPDAEDLTVDELEKSLRWDLIRSKIVKTYDIKIEKEDIDNILREDAIRTMNQYFGGVQSQQMLDQYVKTLSQDKEYINNAYSRILDSKVSEQMLESVKISEESISLEDFNKLK